VRERGGYYLVNEVAFLGPTHGALIAPLVLRPHVNTPWHPVHEGRAMRATRALGRSEGARPLAGPQPDVVRSRGNTGYELNKKLYVGNLSFSSTEEDLRDLFGRHGSVESVGVITDRDTGRSRGFAFVEMEDGQAAEGAMRALDGTDLGGRTIKVNEAESRR
jgi:hypothetical protein